MKTKSRLHAAIGVTALMATAGPAVGQSAQEIADQCIQASNMPPEICTCLGDRAAAELSDAQRQWLILSMAEESDAAMALASAMSLEEATTAAMFTVNTTASCASGG